MQFVPLLGPSQSALFAERGYIVLSGLISAGDVDIAEAEADRLIAELPPPDGLVGPHFYWPDQSESPVLFRVPSLRGGIADACAELSGQGGIEVAFGQTQVSLNIPPYSHRPGRPHIDGFRDVDTVPGTFTLLAGLLLTDQMGDNGGNLWVWPGTHVSHAAYFAARGQESLRDADGHPDVALPEPEQIHGRRGEVLLAHYLLGHNIGGNYEGGRTRCALYWRLRAPGHENRWAACLTDPWLEFERLRPLA